MQQVVLQDAFRKLPKMPGRCKILFIVQLFGKTIYYFLTLDTMIKNQEKSPPHTCLEYCFNCAATAQDK